MFPMKCNSYNLPLLAFAAYGVMWGQEGITTEPLSMCALTQFHEKYDGQLVRLRAEFANSGHGAAVADTRCPEIMLGGYKWLNYACPRESKEPGAASRVGLLWDAAELLAKRRNMNGAATRLEVIVIAKLEVAKVLKPLLMVEGYAQGTGFCSRLDAPFLLHIERVESVTLTEPSSAAPVHGRP